MYTNESLQLYTVISLQKKLNPLKRLFSSLQLKFKFKSLTVRVISSDPPCKDLIIPVRFPSVEMHKSLFSKTTVKNNQFSKV